MAALAELLLQAGFGVSGSDVRSSTRLARLARLGARVEVGHRAENLAGDPGAVIYSAAVARDNPELVAARERGLPLIPRLFALRRLLFGRPLVAVAGTHGKTTTTTWLARLTEEITGTGGHYVGAEIPGLPSAVLGEGPFVMELDESDSLFTAFRPQIAVITNVDADHLHNYGDYGRLWRAFGTLASRAQRVALGVDDPGAAALARERPDALTYGLGPLAELRARGLKFRRSFTSFEVWLSGRRVAETAIPAPGRHNVLDALAALAGGMLLGLPLREMCRRLPGVPRPHRRLEVLEENGYLVVDDYAHHPRELAAGLEAIRLGWPERRIVAVFQPHRYSRTARHGEAFGRVLARADVAVVTGIYSAFEPPIPGISGARIARAARRAGGIALYREGLSQAMETTQGLIAPGDVIACFGAGDVWKLAREMARGLLSGA